MLSTKSNGLLVYIDASPCIRIYKNVSLRRRLLWVLQVIVDVRPFNIVHMCYVGEVGYSYLLRVQSRSTNLRSDSLVF